MKGLMSVVYSLICVTALHITSTAGSRVNKTPLLLRGSLPLTGLVVSRKSPKSSQGKDVWEHMLYCMCPGPREQEHGF